jgi:uncharacterized protein with HEPN domain
MWRDDAYLLDMLLAARKAVKFTQGVLLEQLENDEMLQFATLRALQIIGEAARRISPEFKETHPEIPWSAIVGMRHRLVHEYFRIRVQKVWDVVRDDLPKLGSS